MGSTTIQPSFADPYGANPAGSDPSVERNQSDYIIDGPRPATDVDDRTFVWVDSLGNVTKMENALHQVTTVEHGDPRFPGLVTRVVSPSGVEQRASYDDRGRLLASTQVNPYGDGRDATTTHRWDAIWDHVTSSTLPEGERSTAAYNPSTGDPLWTQQHGDTTRYFFTTPGLMDSTRTSEGAVDRFTYDATLHNVAVMQTPRLATTTIGRDGIGRVLTSVTTTPDASIPTRTQTTSYDLMSQVTRQVDSAGTGTSRQVLDVRSFYAADGLVDSVTQWARPALVRRLSAPGTPSEAGIRRSYRYDAIGRKTAEYADQQLEKSWRYDLAGNVTNGSQDPGDSLVFDALNRQIRRVGVLDSAVFAYDPVTGALTSASNAFARIQRGYYPGGALKWRVAPPEGPFVS